MTETPSGRRPFRVPAIVYYLGIVQTAFAGLFFAFLVGSGRSSPDEAMRQAALLLASFAVADAAGLTLYFAVPRAFAQLLYPLQKGGYTGIHAAARRHVRRGEPGEAAKRYADWIEEHPKDMEARFELAKVLRGPMKRPDRAVAELTKLLELQPMKSWTVAALRELADLYERDLHDPKRAASMDKVIAEYYPDEPEGLEARIRLDRRRGPTHGR